MLAASATMLTRLGYSRTFSALADDVGKVALIELELESMRWREHCQHASASLRMAQIVRQLRSVIGTPSRRSLWAASLERPTPSGA
jgi:hypothetical protein